MGYYQSFDLERMQAYKEDNLLSEGNRVEVDSWAGSKSTYLQVEDVWDKAEWRLQSANYEDVSYAANIEITGRKAVKRYANDCYWVRVKITFPGDCEPDTEAKGWLMVPTYI